MKKVVAFLLVFFIFVSPVTTLVKADVVIGDNDDTIVNENASILGRKLAMLESLSDLALSGVTEFSITDTEDVDSYLDYLWEEVNDAIDYLDSGEWVGEISDSLASKYYTNLVKYRDIVNNRGEFLGFDLQNPATSLLKTYFANDTYGRKYTSTNLYSTLDMYRSLNDLSRNPNTPQPNVNYLDYINQANSNGAYSFFWANSPQTMGRYSNLAYPAYNYSWYSGDYFSVIPYDYSGWRVKDITPCTSILTLYINEDNNGNYIGTISDIHYKNIYSSYSSAYIQCNSEYANWNLSMGNYYGNVAPTSLTYSNSNLASCLSYFTSRFRNINIYVNGDPWAIVGNVTQSNPTLNIDGIIKIYGNDNPRQYELQPNTQIDYDQLYQVIYNAIRDNLPISQGNINYYDSHDTIYSPTIINNYGEEDGDESDLIDTILDYAIIPKFDTAIAQPMRQALTNGVVIMNNSITNVIPNEILLILGACFFLLLFAVVINRMIK